MTRSSLVLALLLAVMCLFLRSSGDSFNRPEQSDRANGSRSYVFICSGGENDTLQLEMTVPTEFSVSENRSESFPCRAVKDVKRVRCKRNGTFVATVNVASQTTIPKNGSNQYVSILINDWQGKNFTLTLQQQGDYVCYIEDTGGNIYTFLNLTVKEASGQTNVNTQPIHGGQYTLTTDIIITVVVVALVALAALAAFGIYRWIKRRKSRPEPKDGEAPEDVQMNLITGNR